MYRLNEAGTHANKIGTGEWHSVDSSDEYLAWVAAGNEPQPPGPKPIPSTVSKRQATRALLAAGLLDTVEAAIAQMPREAQIDWRDAGEIERSNPLVQTMAAALSLDLDALFAAAGAL